MSYQYIVYIHMLAQTILKFHLANPNSSFIFEKTHPKAIRYPHYFLKLAIKLMRDGFEYAVSVSQ